MRLIADLVPKGTTNIIMADIRTIEPGKYNNKLAEALKESGDFTEPTWINFVKSGPNKMRPISEPDFWYKRSASVLRQLYVRGIVGVGRLRTRYGSRKKNGMQPEHFAKSGGKIIRVILQQAEAAGFVEKVKAKHAGRQLTFKGKKFMEEVAAK
jgi:small subunit ribosomal protein S19e